MMCPRRMSILLIIGLLSGIIFLAHIIFFIPSCSSKEPLKKPTKINSVIDRILYFEDQPFARMFNLGDTEFIFKDPSKNSLETIRFKGHLTMVFWRSDNTDIITLQVTDADLTSTPVSLINLGGPYQLEVQLDYLHPSFGDIYLSSGKLISKMYYHIKIKEDTEIPICANIDGQFYVEDERAYMVGIGTVSSDVQDFDGTTFAFTHEGPTGKELSEVDKVIKVFYILNRMIAGRELSLDYKPMEKLKPLILKIAPLLQDKTDVLFDILEKQYGLSDDVLKSVVFTIRFLGSEKDLVKLVSYLKDERYQFLRNSLAYAFRSDNEPIKDNRITNVLLEVYDENSRKPSKARLSAIDDLRHTLSLSQEYNPEITRMFIKLSKDKNIGESIRMHALISLREAYILEATEAVVRYLQQPNPRPFLTWGTIAGQSNDVSTLMALEIFKKTQQALKEPPKEIETIIVNEKTGEKFTIPKRFIEVETPWGNLSLGIDEHTPRYIIGGFANNKNKTHAHLINALLSNILQDEQSELRQDAFQTLCRRMKYDTSAEEVLLNILSETTPTNKSWAVRELGHQGLHPVETPKIIEKLLDLLKEEQDIKLRLVVITTLGEIGGMDIIGSLQIIAQSSSSEEIREAIAKAVKNIIGRINQR